MRFIFSNPSITCDSTMEEAAATYYLHRRDLKKLIDTLPVEKNLGGEEYVTKKDLINAIHKSIANHYKKEFPEMYKQEAKG